MPSPGVDIGPLREADLPEAERIMRTAFGTFLGVPEPATCFSDLDYIYSRWRAPHVAAFAARRDGRLVGSNFATRWGSLGFFGPVSVEVGLQDQGIAQALLQATVAQFDAWGLHHAGLFTFADSARHIRLYGKFGFYPRFLTAIMARPVDAGAAAPDCRRFGALDDHAQAQALDACRALAGGLLDGLDLTAEITAVRVQGLGDTVLLDGPGGLAGFAICHHGPRSESGADTCFIKFGAVRPSASAAADLLRLLQGCDALASEAGTAKLLAGVNLARQEAYELLQAEGFRTTIQGVALHRGNDPAHSRPGLFVIDDWR